MAYQVSARRWRPQTFADLVGQEHVSRTLANAIIAGRVAHAFLFTGVRGVGKTTAARILAKALNCEQGPTPTPCNACTNCVEITAGAAVDVLEIDGASNTGVDDVREIIENVRYQAAKSRYKLYIIDEVHMLSNSAFNALLKTLEEPPAHVKFIFATTDPHKLPATVQSRCQRYDFRRIPLAAVVARLRQIVEADEIRNSDQALFILAREGEGSMRDAQSLLDQVLAGATPGAVVEDAQVLDLLGLADRAAIAALADAVIDRDPARVLAPLDEAYQRGCDLRRFTRDLLEHFRNLAVAKVSGGALLPDLADAEVAALRGQAERIAAADCDRAFNVLLAADDEVARAPDPKLVLEMALLKLASLPPLVPVDELLTRLDGLDARLRGGAVAPRPAAAPSAPAPRAASPARATTAAARSEPAPASAPASAPAAGADPAATWGDFVTFAQTRRPTLADHLSKCAVRGLDGGVGLTATKGFRFDYLSRKDHQNEIEELAASFYGRPVRVLIQAGDVGAAPTPETPVKPSGAEMKNAALAHPTVQAAVAILGGEVAEVRERRPRRREAE
ncbi:MAG: DNA polymerase III subunit gamma/tau [Deltaproteobacteria bacterium]|nr:DNA polymerase III subunit gamma/tau [Deltaproteobacteria bacterium]